MRIALGAPASVVHTVRWANGLSDAGHGVHVLTGHGCSNEMDSSVEVVELPGPRPLCFFHAPFVRRWLDRVDPDVFHCHYASTYGALQAISGFHPRVLSVWGIDVYEVPGRSPLHRLLVRTNLRSADQLCSTSHVMADVTRRVAASDLDIEVVPFGVDLSRFRPTGTGEGEGDARFVIGTVKTLEPKYGIDTLLRTFARVLEARAGDTGQRGQMYLRIAGRGPQEAELRELADELGIAARTEFLGQVPHTRVPDVLRSLDLYCALSRDDSESFGVAVLEAMACGVPVVVSDVDGFREIVEHGEDGLIVPRDRPQAAAEAVLSLFCSDERRRSLARSGRAKVVDRYSWEASLRRMSDVYESLV